jgi:hypothetical protein
MNAQLKVSEIGWFIQPQKEYTDVTACANHCTTIVRVHHWSKY